MTRIKGTVKWYGGTSRAGQVKHFGFIEPESGAEDVFVHQTDLVKAGLHALAEGQRVEFELRRNKARRGGMCATNIKLIDAA